MIERLGLDNTNRGKLEKSRIKTLDNKVIEEEAVLATNEEKIQKIFTFRVEAIKTAIRILKNHPEWAEDVVDEAIVKAWKNLDKFKHVSKLSTWFYQIVINTALGFLRLKKNTDNVPLDITFEDGDSKSVISDPSLNPEQLTIKRQESKLLRASLKSALDKLKESQREAIIMTELKGMTGEEAAEQQNMLSGTMRTNKKRGMKALRRKKIISQLRNEIN